MTRTRGTGSTAAHLVPILLVAASAGGLVALARASKSPPPEPRSEREIRVILSGYGMPPDRLMRSDGGHASQKTRGRFGLSAVAETSCLMGFSSRITPSDSPLSPKVAVSWRLEGRMLSIEGDTATIDLRWARDVRLPGLSPGDSIEHRATLTLREDEALPIDLVRVLPDAGFECGHYVVELGFDFVEPPEVADARLDYDLWLVHREPDGREVTEHLRAGGDQGAEVEYGFAPLWHDNDGTLLEAERDGAFRTTISGEVKGRARLDGLIDVRVEAERWISAELEGRAQGRVGQGSGVKYLSVHPGETIEIALPPVAGNLTLIAPGEEERFELSELFAGAKTALRITTSRVR